MGFFLHTPLPALEILLALPRHEDLMRAFSAYDLVGFHTVNDLSAFFDYIVLEAGGEVLPDGVSAPSAGRSAPGLPHRAGHRRGRQAGVTARQFTGAEAAGDDPAEKTIDHRVDRLDYSKGLVARFSAFEKLLAADPQMHNKVTLMQIAPPSRGDVTDYVEIRRELETNAGHINGQYADFDWVPIRYLNKSFGRSELTCFYRMSRVGLVTPLRDGMNLVAKEFVASQGEADPGVLVLSRSPAPHTK